MKRREKPAGPQGAAAGLDLTADSVILHPLVFSHLGDVAWDDGQPRQGSTLTVFVEHGRVKLCLNDRAEGVTAWVSGRSLEEALASLEAGLANDALDWRRSAGANGRGRRA